MAPISALFLAAALGSSSPRFASTELTVTTDVVQPVAVVQAPADQTVEERLGADDVIFLASSGSIVFTDGAPRTFVLQDREQTSRDERERP